VELIRVTSYVPGKGTFVIDKNKIDGFNSYLCENPECLYEEQYHNVILYCGMEIPLTVEEAKRVSYAIGVEPSWVQEGKKKKIGGIN
jgi:hypothetical protein